MARGDLEKRGMNIFRHSFGIATNIEVGAILQPTPKLGTFLLHPMLDVDFVSLVPRESGG